ncbi:transportin-3-like isoform X2 [Watersipora subatra]|uniref:transportin-3-like isoform X2 n=1 Tax=Watersipora subatra TaxID=2589382 RepID=UPI00355C5F40
MDPEPTISAVLQALNALYHSPDTQMKEAASKWLESFQKSIQHHFYELPPESHGCLKDSLLNHIASCDNNTTAAVITQLSLALADLALLMATWKNAVPDLLGKFAPNPSSYHVLLEVLTVLPEEVSSRHLRLGKNRRTEVTDLLLDSFDGVHQFLLACLSHFHTDQVLCSKLLKCLSSWFNIGAVPADKIQQSQLIPAIFHFLMDANSQSQLHEAATDCLCSALYQCEDINRYGHLAQALFERILALHNNYIHCAAQSDTDRCLNFARIFTEMAESFIEALVQFPNKGLGSFSQLELICSTLDNEAFEVAEICFNFWYSLSESLYQLDDSSLNAQFSPFVQKVILSLCNHVKLDTDQEGILERSDDFFDFRLRASELIKDVVFVVSSNKLFRELSTQLSSGLPWNVSEAYLFVMCAVAANIDPKEDVIVRKVINTVMCEYCSPPDRHHVALTYTCVALLGEFNQWIRHNPSTLDTILQLLLLCLRNPKLSNMAATSLDQICGTCAEESQMLQSFPMMLQVVEEMDSFNITSDSTVKLIKAAAVILSKFSGQQLSQGVKQLCSYQVEPLKKLVLVEQSLSKADRSTKRDPGLWLDRLTSVLRYGVPPMDNGLHPCYEVIAELWSTFSDVCHRYQSDIKIIEKCCRCIRFVIRNLGSSFTPLLAPLVELMVSLYAVHLHSCYLYLGAILVDVFGRDPGCVKGLLDMTQALAMPTFQLLSKPDGLVHHSDTVDDFFRLCLRFLQKDRVSFLNLSINVPMFKCAIAAATLQHREANASVMRFFVELFQIPHASEICSSEEALVKQNQVIELLKADGAELVDTLLQCCVSALPAMMMVDVADVFTALLAFDRSSVSTWLQDSLQKLPRESTGGVVTATPQQLKDFHLGLCSSTDSSEVTPLLKDLLVLYR